MKEIEDFKTEMKSIKKNLKKQMIRYKTSKLFGNFNFEKGFIMEETKKIGAKLEKLEISSRVIDAINKKSILRTL